MVWYLCFFLVCFLLGQNARQKMGNPSIIWTCFFLGPMYLPKNPPPTFNHQWHCPLIKETHMIIDNFQQIWPSLRIIRDLNIWDSMQQHKQPRILMGFCWGSKNQSRESHNRRVLGCHSQNTSAHIGPDSVWLVKTPKDGLKYPCKIISVISTWEIWNLFKTQPSWAFFWDAFLLTTSQLTNYCILGTATYCTYINDRKYTYNHTSSNFLQPDETLLQDTLLLFSQLFVRCRLVNRCIDSSIPPDTGQSPYSPT